MPSSKWGNPFKISPACTRTEAISRFKAYFKDQGLFGSISEIVGRDLLCHCRLDEACHGDYLLAMAHHAGEHQVPSMVDFVDDGLPVRIEAPVNAEPPELVPAVSAGWRGSGPPRVARHIGGDKPFCDGGGLCSPGRWPPAKRRLPSCLGGLRGRCILHSPRPSV